MQVSTLFSLSYLSSFMTSSLVSIRLSLVSCLQVYLSDLSSKSISPLTRPSIFFLSIIFFFYPSNLLLPPSLPSLNHTGTKAGYLGSAYFVGSFTGSLLWGWISDKIGRRPVLLMGMLGTLATELLFGFSQNFAWAIAARFLWGLLNGNLGVAKTYISEVYIYIHT